MTINVKVNNDWKQIEGGDNLCEFVNCPSVHLPGAALYRLLSVPSGDDLWRCCDDGMGDERIHDSNDADKAVTVFEDDWFYTAAREINGNG